MARPRGWLALLLVMLAAVPALVTGYDRTSHTRHDESRQERHRKRHSAYRIRRHRKRHDANRTHHTSQHAPSGADARVLALFQRTLGEHPPKINTTYFCMVKSSRTGSTFFSSMVSNNPFVIFQPEALNAFKDKSPTEKVLELLQMYLSMHGKFLAPVKAQARSAWYRDQGLPETREHAAVAVGLSLSFQKDKNVLADPTSRAMLGMLARHLRIRVLWWRRGNAVKWALSEIYRRQNSRCGGWNLRVEAYEKKKDCWSDTMAVQPMKLLHTMAAHLRNLDRLEDSIRVMNSDPAAVPQLFYEQSQANLSNTLQQLYLWLGVPAAGNTTPATVKLMSEDLRKRVVTFDALDEVLRGTCWEQQLHNVDPGQLNVSSCEASRDVLSKLVDGVRRSGVPRTARRSLGRRDNAMVNEVKRTAGQGSEQKH